MSAPTEQGTASECRRSAGVSWCDWVAVVRKHHGGDFGWRVGDDDPALSLFHNEYLADRTPDEAMTDDLPF